MQRSLDGEPPRVARVYPEQYEDLLQIKVEALEGMIATAVGASAQSDGAEPVGVVEVESESEGGGKGEGATRVAIAFREYSARPLAGDMVNCTGAGDSLVAGIVAGMLDGYSRGADGAAGEIHSCAQCRHTDPARQRHAVPEEMAR